MRLKDHIIRDVVTNLRDVAIEFHAAGQLRERLRHALEPLLTQQVDRIAPAPDHAPQVVADERQAFEAAARRITHSDDYSFEREGDDYADYTQSRHWSFWQARAALAAAPVQAQEPVARVSDRLASDDGTNDEITAYLPVGTALFRAPVQPMVVPDGWKLVPAKPTQEMIQYAADCTKQIGSDNARIMVSAYKFMLEAAPAAPAAQVQAADALPAEHAKLAVGVHADDESVTVAVHLKQGERTTVLYTQSHSSKRDSLGVVDFPASLFTSPAHPVAVPDGKEFARIEHERNTLAQAVADAALKSGIWNGKGPLTGPRLLTMLDDMASCIDAPAAQGEVARNQDPLCDLRFDVAIDAIAASKAAV